MCVSDVVCVLTDGWEFVNVFTIQKQRINVVLMCVALKALI